MLLKNLYNRVYYWLYPPQPKWIDQIAPCVDPKPLEPRELIVEPDLAKLNLRIHYGRELKSE